MSLAYDPLKWADCYNSEFEMLLDTEQLDLNEVKELFTKGLITLDELKYAEEYLNA